MGQQVLEAACERHTRMWDGGAGGEKAGGDQDMACGWRRMTESSGSRLQNRHGKALLLWSTHEGEKRGSHLGSRETLTQRRGESFSL
jgi:hypothetical protein